MLLTLSAVAGVHVVQRVIANGSFQGQAMSSRFSGRICVVVADRERGGSFIAARENQDRVQNGQCHAAHRPVVND